MSKRGLTPTQRALKRALDLAVAVPTLILALPIIVLAALVATIDTGAWGVFSQERIGRGGQPFTLFKVRTMRATPHINSTVTSLVDARITLSGRLFRRFKIDELPQLYNVVVGDMSLVGPRPDVPGFADRLEGDDRIVLSVRPGITGPATLQFRDEEQLLAEVSDPEYYNRTVLWPEKVRINRRYIEQYSLAQDVRVLGETLAKIL